MWARSAGRVLGPSAIHLQFPIWTGVPIVEIIPSIYCPPPATELDSRSSAAGQTDPSDGHRLLYVGRLIEWKGPDRLAKIVPAVLELGLPVTLTVVIGPPTQYGGGGPPLPPPLPAAGPR